MSKIRMCTMLSASLIAMMTFTGCNIKVLDTGSSKVFTVETQKEETKLEDGSSVDQSMYIDLSLLNRESDINHSYTTYEVKKGDFQTVYSMDKGEIGFGFNSVPVKADYKKGNMYFESFDETKLYQYVAKGDDLVHVCMDVDMTEVTELEIKLNRYEQRLKDDEANYIKQAKEYKESIDKAQSITDKIELTNRYEQSQIQWEKTKKDWNKTIKDTKELIQEYKESAHITSIKAERDGIYIVTNFYGVKEGQVIYNDTNLGYIIPISPIYLSVDNKSGNYSYGKKVEVSLASGKKFEGTVINLDKKLASTNVYDETAWIQVDCQIPDIGNSQTASLSVVTQQMENVLLVDRAAVTREDDGSTYVTVLNDDGSLCKKGFIAGGSNQQYYWVYSGLSEGMHLVKVNN